MKGMKKVIVCFMRYRFFSLLFLLFLFLSCRTVPVKKGRPFVLPLSHTVYTWEKYEDGLDILSFHGKDPFFSITAIRIDLSCKRRSVVVSKGIKPLQGNETGENNFRARTINQFMRDTHAIAAINATPFRPYRLFTGGRQTAVGIVVSDGVLYSNTVKYDAVFISKRKKVFIASPPFSALNTVQCGAGGFFIILKNGKNTGYRGFRDTRSLAGTDKKGRMLILAVMDRKNTGYGHGITLYEAAAWMHFLGACNAISLDGGGSSVLALRSIQTGKVTLLNHSDRIFVFPFQRHIPVYIGIR